MESEGHPGLTWSKAIPEQRDRMQSQILTWSVGLLLAAACIQTWRMGAHGTIALEALTLSTAFVVLVLMLKAGTNGAARVGGMICFLIIFFTAPSDMSALRSGVAPLIALFILTYLATRFGRKRKTLQGLAENSRGRRASQVVANLGAGGLICTPVVARYLGGLSPHHLRFVSWPIYVVLLATLVEATADTVASELGQVLGGEPRLLFSMRKVAPGTDGAISAAGTFAGAAGGCLVMLVGLWSLQLPWQAGLNTLISGLLGFLFDSVLGATIERRGWLGNDLVNFCSTLFSAGSAFCLLLLFRDWWAIPYAG